MTTFYSFRPEYFNNNGDQGNLEVLEHFTNQKFVPASIEDADFVLVGDASRAAMREFSSELDELVGPLSKRLNAGAPTLLVGSSYEFFAPKVPGMPALSYGPRVSEFRDASVANLRVKGYRNSEVQGDDLFLSGLFVGTTLFGPVLAKNLALTEIFAKGMGLELRISDQERSWIEKI